MLSDQTRLVPHSSYSLAKCDGTSVILVSKPAIAGPLGGARRAGSSGLVGSGEVTGSIKITAVIFKLLF